MRQFLCSGVRRGFAHAYVVTNRAVRLLHVRLPPSWCSIEVCSVINVDVGFGCPEPAPARMAEWERVGRVPLWSCQSTDAVPGMARVRRVLRESGCRTAGQAASSRRMVRRL